jgi:hypothetical protein
MEDVLAESGSMTILDSDLKSLLPLLQLGSDANPTPSAHRREGQK